MKSGCRLRACVKSASACAYRPVRYQGRRPLLDGAHRTHATMHAHTQLDICVLLYSRQDSSLHSCVTSYGKQTTTLLPLEMLVVAHTTGK